MAGPLTCPKCGHPTLPRVAFDTLRLAFSRIACPKCSRPSTVHAWRWASMTPGERLRWVLAGGH